MEYKTLLDLAHEGFDEIAAKVVEEFKELSIEECGQAPADLGLLTVWDEYKEQVQNGEGFFFEAYEMTLRQFVRRELGGYIAWELLVLWSATDGANGQTFDSSGDCLVFDEVCEAVENEVYTRIYNRAEFEEIEYRKGYVPEGEIEEDEPEQSEDKAEQLELF